MMKTYVGSISTGSEADERVIWSFLKNKGLKDEAVAGIMGNLNAESALRSNNLEQIYECKLGHTDESYTEGVDNGSYTNFVHDKAGYGLAQWTYWSRKENLLKFARAAGKSIADLQMQLDFLWKELQGYTNVMNVLENAESVREVSDVILVEFESPADQSEQVKATRAAFGQRYYDKYAPQRDDGKSKATKCSLSVDQLEKGCKCAAVKALQILLIGYDFPCGSYGADGDFGGATDSAVKAYQKAVGIGVDGIVGPNTWKKLLGV